MKNIILATILLIAFNSCTKKTVSAVSFGVTTDSASYHAGDTVTFRFSGNPDYIVFYSGEPGHNYLNRNRTSVPGGTPILNFMSYEQYGNHQNTIHLLISNNFDGIYDTTDVNYATWNDITGMANFSTGSSNTLSGNINLSSYASQGLPVFIAFQDSDLNDGVNSLRTWSINNLLLVDSLPDNTKSTILDIANSAWLNVSFNPTAAAWTSTTTTLKIGGGSPTSPSVNSWMISQPVILTTVNPDTGVSIKTMTDNPLSSYQYIFANPGTYTVTFDIKNANIYSASETLKTLTITVQ